MERTLTTPDGSTILASDEYGGWCWIGCAGVYSSDDLRDMAKALDNPRLEEEE